MENLERVLQEFNHYHGSEAHARVIEIKKNEVIIEFTGSFCKGCGLYDYFEDITWSAIEFGLNIEPVEILEANETYENGRYVVKYRIRDNNLLGSG